MGSASKVVAYDEEIVGHFLPPLGSTSGTVTVIPFFVKASTSLFLPFPGFSLFDGSTYPLGLHLGGTPPFYCDQGLISSILTFSPPTPCYGGVTHKTLFGVSVPYPWNRIL